MLISETARQAAERQTHWDRRAGEGTADDRSVRRAVTTTLLAVSSLLLVVVAMLLGLR